MADAVQIKDTDTDDQVREKIPCFGGVFSAVDDTCRKCAINVRCVKLIAKALPGYRAELKTSLGRGPTPAEVAEAAGLETETNLDIVMKHAQGIPLPVLLGLSTAPPPAAPAPVAPPPKKGPPTVPAKAPPPPAPVAVAAPAPVPPPPAPSPKKAPPITPAPAPEAPTKQAKPLTPFQESKAADKAARDEAKAKKAADKKPKAAKVPTIVPDVDPVAKGEGLYDADGNLPDVHDGGTHAMPLKPLPASDVIPDMPAGIEPTDEVVEALARSDEAAIATPPAPDVVTPPEAPKAPMKKTTTPPKKAPAPKAPPAPKATKVPSKPAPTPAAKKAPAKAAKAKAPKPEKVPTIKPASKAKAPPPKASTPMTGIDVRAFARERARSTWVAANLKPGLQITRVYKGDTFALLVFADHYAVRKNGGKEVTYPTATRATEAITGVGSYPRENGSDRAYSTHSVPRFWRAQEGAVAKTPPTSSVPAAKKVVPVKAAKKPVVKAVKKPVKKPTKKPAAAKPKTVKKPAKKAAAAKKKPTKKKKG